MRLRRKTGIPTSEELSFPRPLASGELLQNPKREKLENLNE